MKDIAKGLLIAGAMIGASSVSAFDLCGGCPYVGAEYEWTSTGGNNHHNGGDDFRRHHRGFGKNYNGGNFFVGARWCDFGAEFGYEFTERKKRSRRVTLTGTQLERLIGTTDANAYLAAGGTGVTGFRTKSRFEGWHLDFNGYMPVCDCVELIGSIGYGWMKPNVSAAIALARPGTFTLPDFAVSPNGGVLFQKLHTHRGYKGVFRLGAGIQSMLTECIGARAMIRWKNTNNLRVHGRHGSSTANLTHHHSFKPNNAWSLAAGVFVKF